MDPRLDPRWVPTHWLGLRSDPIFDSYLEDLCLASSLLNAMSPYVLGDLWIIPM